MTETAHDRETRDISRLAMALTSIGLGALISWTYIVFLSWAVLTPEHGDANLLDKAHSVSYMGLVVALLVLAILSRPGTALASRIERCVAGTQGARLSPAVALASVSALVMCAGTVVIIAGEQGQLGRGVYHVAALASGAGLGALFAQAATKVSRLPRRSIPVCLAIAFVIAAALYTLALHLPSGPTHIISLILPLVGASLLILPVEGDASASAQDEGLALKGMAPQDLPRAIVCFCVLGFAEGVARGFFLQANPHANPVLHRWVFLMATVIACLLLLLAAFHGRGLVGITSAGRAGMLMLAFMFLLAPIVEELGLVADVLTNASHILLLLIEWTLLAQYVNAYRPSAARAFGFGLGIAYLGWVAGDVTGNALAPRFGSSYHLESLIALVCACLTMLAFFLIVHDRSIAEVVSEDDHAGAPRRFMERCEDVAREYGLTKKETEVMVLIAKGRSAQRVQEIMGIAAGTVNTHLAHIYRKLNVHTRQEMLDKIER